MRDGTASRTSSPRLREFGIAALVADPLADFADAKVEYGVELVPLEHFARLDGLILAVPRQILAEGGSGQLFAALAPGGVFVERRVDGSA